MYLEFSERQAAKKPQTRCCSLLLHFIMLYSVSSSLCFDYFPKKLDLALGDIAFIWQIQKSNRRTKEELPHHVWSEIWTARCKTTCQPAAVAINMEINVGGGYHANLLQNSLWTCVIKRALKQHFFKNLLIFSSTHFDCNPSTVVWWLT